MAKVRGYTRSDGTKVSAHEREIDARGAAVPTPSARVAPEVLDPAFYAEGREQEYSEDLEKMRDTLERIAKQKTEETRVENIRLAKENFHKWLKQTVVPDGNGEQEENALFDSALEYATTKEGEEEIERLLAKKKLPQAARDSLTVLQVAALEAGKETRELANYRDEQIALAETSGNYIDPKTTIGRNANIETDNRIVGKNRLSNCTISSTTIEGTPENSVVVEREVISGRDSEISMSHLVGPANISGSNVEKSLVRGKPYYPTVVVNSSLLSATVLDRAQVERSEVENSEVSQNATIEYVKLSEGSVVTDAARVSGENVYYSSHTRKLELVSSTVSGNARITQHPMSYFKNSVKSIIRGTQVRGEAEVSVYEGDIIDSVVEENATVSAEEGTIVNTQIGGTASVTTNSETAKISGCQISGDAVVRGGSVSNVVLTEEYLDSQADVRSQKDVQVVHKDGAIYTRHRGKQRLRRHLRRPWRYTKKEFDPTTGEFKLGVYGDGDRGQYYANGEEMPKIPEEIENLPW